MKEIVPGLRTYFVRRTKDSSAGLPRYIDIFTNRFVNRYHQYAAAGVYCLEEDHYIVIKDREYSVGEKVVLTDVEAARKFAEKRAEINEEKNKRVCGEDRLWGYNWI